LAESPFRRSDYFKRFASGTLTKDQVWGHIAQHYLLIAWFPRIFSGIHTRCEDLEVRKDCARHLLVEDLGYFEGRVGGTPDHDELFRRIGDDLGYARDEYARIVPVPEMAAIVAFFGRLAHEVPWSASLCATALLEEEGGESARTAGTALGQTAPAELDSFELPVPTQVVSNGEYNPLPQTREQQRVEARIKELADDLGPRHGLSRRSFLASSAGMAAAFLAMNDVFGPVFEVSRAEAQQPGVAAQRAGALAGQFIIDVQTHFVRDDFKQAGLLDLAKYAKKNWNPA